MLFWLASTPIPIKEIEEDSLLSSFLLHNSNKPQPSNNQEYLKCPVTNFGYDGLHVFIWGACKDTPEWTISPQHPELMGCEWMARDYKICEIKKLKEMLETLHNEVSTMCGECGEKFNVELSDLILPVHEDELLSEKVIPLFSKQVHIFAIRPQVKEFILEEQMKRIEIIYKFVDLCEKHKADITWSSSYEYRVD